MTKLIPCPHCGSFLPPSVPLSASRICPGCSRAVARGPRLPAPVRALLAVGGGGLLSVTLSACYGAPCAGGACYEPDTGPPTCTDWSQDIDNDGYCLDQDCDESNANVHDGVGCPLAGDGGLGDGGAGEDAGMSGDGGLSDGGTSDGGTSDGGTSDGGTSDGGAPSDADL